MYPGSTAFPPTVLEMEQTQLLPALQGQQVTSSISIPHWAKPMLTAAGGWVALCIEGPAGGTNSTDYDDLTCHPLIWLL